MTTTITIKAGNVKSEGKKVRVAEQDSESEKVSYITEDGGEMTVTIHGNNFVKIREVGGGADRTIVKA